MKLLLWQKIAIGICVLLVSSWWLAGARERAMYRYATPEARKVWVIEDERLMWRPNSRGERIVIAIFTLGMGLSNPELMGREAKGADLRSFRALTHSYGKDRNTVWHQGLPLEGADVESFQPIVSHIGRDKDAVWWGAKRLEGADPDRFRVADQGYAYDDTTIWQSGVRLMDHPGPLGAELTVYSYDVIAIEGQGYFRDIALPQLPRGEITTFCSDWYAMNDALWHRAERVSAFDAGHEIIACGRTPPHPDQGILFATQTAVLSAGLDGQVDEIMGLDAPIQQTVEIDAFRQRRDVYLLHLEDGGVFLLSAGERPAVQRLGGFETLDLEEATKRSGEIWLGDHFFNLDLDKLSDEEPLAHYEGRAEVLGDYTRIEDELFYRGRFAAKPGDLPLFVQRPSRVTIGSMCFDFGNYVSDVRSGLLVDATPGEWSAVCATNRPPQTLFYDGLEILFEEDSKTGATVADGLTEYQLGRVILRNAGDEPRSLDADFVRAIDFFVHGYGPPQKVSVEYPEVDESSHYRLEPGAQLDWEVRVRAGDDVFLGFPYFLELVHSPERARITGQERHRFASGQIEKIRAQ